MANEIHLIAPYWRDKDGWGCVCGDEPGFGLGADAIIDDLVKEIAHARTGFRLLLSAAPFPGYRRKLVHVPSEHKVWLCEWWYAPDGSESKAEIFLALTLYFDEPPEEIYLKAEPKTLTVGPDLSKEV